MKLPQHLIDTAMTLADISAATIKPYFRSALGIEDKQDASPVTAADRGAEEAMRAYLSQHRPQDGVIGEEFGSHQADAEWVWVLDPIDGTKSFTVGRPLFVTLIALLHHGVPVFGVINQPINQERWYGGPNEPTRFNGELVTPTQVTQLNQARIGSTGPEYLPTIGERFAELARNCRYQIWGGDGYLYAQVCSGWLEIVVEEGLQLHDFAALAPIIQGAGGVMTDWHGKPLTLTSKGNVVAAANVDLHQQAVTFLQQQTQLE